MKEKITFFFMAPLFILLEYCELHTLPKLGKMLKPLWGTYIPYNTRV